MVFTDAAKPFFPPQMDQACKTFLPPRRGRERQSDGLWIDFFGKPTSTTSVPARLALRTGAALIPAYCLREASGQYRICIKPEVPIEGGPQDAEKATTSQLNRLLEKEFLEHPEQWIWNHRRWKDYSRYRSS